MNKLILDGIEIQWAPTCMVTMYDEYGDFVLSFEQNEARQVAQWILENVPEQPSELEER